MKGYVFQELFAFHLLSRQVPEVLPSETMLEDFANQNQADSN